MKTHKTAKTKLKFISFEGGGGLLITEGAKKRIKEIWDEGMRELANILDKEIYDKWITTKGLKFINEDRKIIGCSEC